MNETQRARLHDEAYIQAKLGHLAWKVFKATCGSDNYDVIQSWLYIQYSVDNFRDLSTEEFEDCQLVVAVCKLAEHANLTKETHDGYHTTIDDAEIRQSIMEHQVAVRQMPNRPRYPHDCERCVFLGGYMQYDLYYCIPNKTPVARYGEDSAYHSGVENFLTFPDIYPQLGQALARAILVVESTAGERFSVSKKEAEPVPRTLRAAKHL